MASGSLSTPYNQAHHRFAVFIAFTTFVLLIAGALVTSNDAGLSVPDWPTSFGHVFKLPPMVGGIRFEHTHRMVAEFVGFCTIVLAIWTWKTDRRSWMKKLGIAALATVVAQGVLGGITVLKLLPPAVSTAHATLAQTFFCIAVSIALFTGRKWVGNEARQIVSIKRPSLPTLAALSMAAVYAQLILGAAFRHKGFGIAPHLLNAVLVTVVLVWTITRVLADYSQVSQLRRPAMILLWLLIAQLCLGFMAYLTKVVWGAQAVQPMPAMVLSTVAHLAVGALVLATTLVLFIQSWRHVAVPHEERVTGTPKAVAA